MQLGVQNLLLALQQIAAQQLGFHVLKAQALDGLGEPLAGLALFPEEEDGLLDDVQGFLLIGEDLGEGAALGKVFTDKEEALNVIEKAILLFREQGKTGERFAKTIERLGFENVEAQLLGGDLLERKQQILDAESKDENNNFESF